MWDQVVRCPTCTNAYWPGDSACKNCGAVLESVAGDPVDLSGFPVLTAHGDAPQPTFLLHVLDDAVVKFRGQPIRTICISDDELVIGRRDPPSGHYPDVDLQDTPDFGYTARRHARLHVEGDRMYVTDLKGADTTAINDLNHTLRQNVPQELRNGDRLIIGDTVSFRIELTDSI